MPKNWNCLTRCNDAKPVTCSAIYFNDLPVSLLTVSPRPRPSMFLETYLAMLLVGVPLCGFISSGLKRGPVLLPSNGAYGLAGDLRIRRKS